LKERDLVAILQGLSGQRGTHLLAAGPAEFGEVRDDRDSHSAASCKVLDFDRLYLLNARRTAHPMWVHYRLCVRAKHAAEKINDCQGKLSLFLYAISEGAPNASWHYCPIGFISQQGSGRHLGRREYPAKVRAL
jgi:hypothetical protein